MTLNSITLSVATHSKLRKAADGIGIQVATCMINKWMAKINGEEVYNARGPHRKGQVVILTIPESFCS